MVRSLVVGISVTVISMTVFHAYILPMIDRAKDNGSAPDGNGTYV